jgi:molybdopterin-guanine dinucleotide biosynthesis protein A
LLYRGSTFVDRVLGAARSVVEEVVLLGNGELNTPGSRGMLRLADEPNSGGPLAGLVPLLEYAGERWALLIACDMPLVESVILRRLLGGRKATVDAVAFRVANGAGEYSPCCAVFHPRVARAARSELAQSRGLQALLARVRCRVLNTDAWEVGCLRSVNTPGEYAELASFGGEFERDALFQ